jgi:hypothetical protein
MGIESTLTVRVWDFERQSEVGFDPSGPETTMERRLTPSLPTMSELILGIRARRDTRRVRVPEQAYVPPIDGSYEVSEELSTAIDLQRICCGVSFSIKAIAPPQYGQSHEH